MIPSLCLVQQTVPFLAPPSTLLNREEMSCGSRFLTHRDLSNRVAACHQRTTVTAAFN